MTTMTMKTSLKSEATTECVLVLEAQILKWNGIPILSMLHLYSNFLQTDKQTDEHTALKTELPLWR